MIQRPDLEFNYFYPFYTQEKWGRQKFSRFFRTTMHLAIDRGIEIYIVYDKQKVRQLTIEACNDVKVLSKRRLKHKHITYVDFAAQIKSAYNAIRRALDSVSKEPAYVKRFIFSSYLKYSSELEFEVDWGKINLSFDKVDWTIKEGKIHKPKKERVIEDSETALAIKTLDAFVDEVDNRTSFQEISNTEFQMRVDGAWNEYLKYFAPPRFLRKNNFHL